MTADDEVTIKDNPSERHQDLLKIHSHIRVAEIS